MLAQNKVAHWLPLYLKGLNNDSRITFLLISRTSSVQNSVLCESEATLGCKVAICCKLNVANR